MAGHSRWAQVKHRKAGADAKRGALFSKLTRLITAASREGGHDPAANARLRAAIEQARDAGLPKGNIERAVARAAGRAAADALVSRQFEAYGPGASAYLIEVLTDNPNRTAGDLKRILADADGRMADAGSVAWMFERRAVVAFTPAAPDALEAATLALIDAGALEVEAEGGTLYAAVAPEAVGPFQRAAAGRGLTATRTDVAMVPKATVAIGPDERVRAEALADALADHPDVIAVSTNIQPVP